MRHILVFVIDMIVIPMPSQSTEGVDDLLDASVEIELKLQFPGPFKVLRHVSGSRLCTI